MRGANIAVGEWTLECYDEHSKKWQNIFTNKLQLSLEACIEWWRDYTKPIWKLDYRIRNLNTGEIIPCAALT